MQVMFAIQLYEQQEGMQSVIPNEGNVFPAHRTVLKCHTALTTAQTKCVGSHVCGDVISVVRGGALSETRFGTQQPDSDG
jgi:hypothetical protein